MSMFTTRHYKAIAERLNPSWQVCQLMKDEQQVGFYLIVANLANLFMYDNSNFDRDKFYEAIFGKEVPTFSD